MTAQQPRPAAAPERAPKVGGAGSTQEPLTIEVTRGNLVESRHRVAFAVCDPDGRVLLQGGDIEQPIYARSAIKPLQALALVETGAADAFELGDIEIALACASHNGEPRQVEAVRQWLARIGCSPDDLECGAQLPAREGDRVAMIRGGEEATAAHNNCSGKHSGFLTAARHLGYPTAGYIGYEHPIQQRVLGILESLTGLNLAQAPRGVDGCGIPVIGFPLGHLALAFARFGQPDDQPEARQGASARIRQAMAAEPYYVAGTDRFCTRVMEVTGPLALIKTGAEGVYCGALPEAGLGIALKAADGAGRAGSVAMGALLRRFGAISDDQAKGLAGVLTPVVTNRAGLEVGQVRPGNLRAGDLRPGAAASA